MQGGQKLKATRPLQELEVGEREAPLTSSDSYYVCPSDEVSAAPARAARRRIAFSMSSPCCIITSGFFPINVTLFVGWSVQAGGGSRVGVGPFEAWPGWSCFGAAQGHSLTGKEDIFIVCDTKTSVGRRCSLEGALGPGEGAGSGGQASSLGLPSTAGVYCGCHLIRIHVTAVNGP
jgi:hypothetical protein